MIRFGYTVEFQEDMDIEYSQEIFFLPYITALPPQQDIR